MMLQLIFFFFSLFVVSAGAALWFYVRSRQTQSEIDACSESIQEIFKLVNEPSAVARVLLQETLQQELVRLKRLLEKREQAILLENAALKQVFNGLPDGLVALDASRRVVLCNPAYCRLVGISEEGHEGQRLFEILRNHAGLKAAEDFLNQSTETFSEVEFVTASEKILKLSMIRLHPNSTVNVILVVTDISKLKRLETMRRDFVANVSHELRTPLTSIHGLIETLLDGAGAGKETRERFLKLMKGDAERLRRLVEDLLTLSRVESQPRGFEKQELNVSKEVEGVAEIFSQSLRHKRLKLEKKIEETLILKVNQDQFRQVLTNLMDNAIKFTPEEGRISIFAGESKNGNIEISVVDTGCGVHPDNREKIFQRFFREDKARSRENGGTGLGLAIVKHILEAHRGNVRCEAGPKQHGTAFILSFPAN